MKEMRNTIVSLNLEQTGDIIPREQHLEVNRPVSSVSIFLNTIRKCLF